MRTNEECLELIQDTVRYIEKNGRAVMHAPDMGDSVCTYRDPHTGRKCAVGCRMTDEAIEELGIFCGGVASLLECIEEKEASEPFFLQISDFDDLLLPEYQGYPIWLWKQLQTLHDKKEFWEENENGTYLNDLGDSVETIIMAPFYEK